MDRKHNSKIVPFAKELRKNMTKEERHLWHDFLRSYHFEGVCMYIDNEVKQSLSQLR